MSTQIDELVKMRDIETLHELMTEDEEWLVQLEAAEGLVQLGDRRGYEFLLTAVMSDDEEILEVAKEILDSPELTRMKNDIEAEREREHRVHIEAAKKRIQSGGKVFRYRMAYLPAAALMGNDPLRNEYPVPSLDDHGLEGWEVITIIPQRRSMMVSSVDDHFTGAYFLLKKEILPQESADLEKE
ncbi:MAG TPA: HEAT repeat domain-containing protein [Anaerolineales bacterium]|nr:HEAT repeat domain-containing protein [Anaerolineales bacterium]